MDIKAIRLHLGLTQKEFAAFAGVTVLAVKRWEAGTRTPSARHLKALGAAVPQAAPAIDAAVVEPRWISLREAVRLMGLQAEGHGRQSDRTIRNAIKSGVLRAEKVPGSYKESIKEWRIDQGDFEAWRDRHYMAFRDPRRNGAVR